MKPWHKPRRPPQPTAGVVPFDPGARLRSGPGRTNAAAASGGHRRKMVAVAALATALATVLAFLMAGCGISGEENTDGQARNPAGEEAPAATPTPDPGNRGDETGPADDGFVASTKSSGGEAGAADRIGGVRFQIFDDYERLVVDFGRDGGTAGVPRWSVESPEEGGYLRVRLPDVTSTAVTQRDFVGAVLDELYVVRGRDGGLFADVFAMRGFRYRVTEMPGSGRLAVDFRGTGQEIELPPTTGEKAVVLQPREAEEVRSPLLVRGYARPLENRVTVSLIGRERRVISERRVRANGSTGTWGLFGATLEYSGYEGLATLRVGSPRDGAFVGTETEVFLE